MSALHALFGLYVDCGFNRNFDFKEKAEVDKYYPQYYHKTDKVRTLATCPPCRTPSDNMTFNSSHFLRCHAVFACGEFPPAVYATTASVRRAFRVRASSNGHGQEGRPLFIESLGLLDFKALYQLTSTERQL